MNPVSAPSAMARSTERYCGLGAEVIPGHARVVDPWTVEVGGRRLTGRRIVIATGAEPALPPIPGLREVEPLTSETLWDLNEKPARLELLSGKDANDDHRQGADQGYEGKGARRHARQSDREIDGEERNDRRQPGGQEVADPVVGDAAIYPVDELGKPALDRTANEISSRQHGDHGARRAGNRYQRHADPRANNAPPATLGVQAPGSDSAVNANKPD